MHKYEDELKQEGFSLLVGIDEAGRGPLAGPVVASAIILKEKIFISRINDSKKMTPLQREKAFEEIHQKAYVGIGIMDAAIIDQKNILQATFLAMHAAIRKLIKTLPAEYKDNFDFSPKADSPLENNKKVCLLIDGNLFRSNLPYAYKTIIKGDSLVFSIACASIIAKVTRDRMLIEYDKTYPQYGFKQHKGYPTKKHKEALHKFGYSPIHRKTFRY